MSRPGRFADLHTPFLLIDEWVLLHPSWRALSAHARAIMIHIWMRWNGKSDQKTRKFNNNGQITYACREARQIDIDKNAATRGLAELVKLGFLDPSGSWQPGFVADGKRRAREFRITFLSTHGRTATWKNHTKNTRRLAFEHRLLRSSAYRTLPSTGKVVLIEMRRRDNGNNNGHIRFGGRDGVRIGLSPDVTERAINQLKQRGFVVETVLGHKRLGIAREWRLTMVKASGKRPTLEFLKWQPEVSNPVPLARTKADNGPAGADGSKPSNHPDSSKLTVAVPEENQDSPAFSADPLVLNVAAEQDPARPRRGDTYREPDASQSGQLISHWFRAKDPGTAHAVSQQRSGGKVREPSAKASRRQRSRNNDPRQGDLF